MPGNEQLFGKIKGNLTWGRENATNLISGSKTVRGPLFVSKSEHAIKLTSVQ